MATTWIKFNSAFQNFAANTTVQTDDSYSQVKSLLAADIAQVVANPGGTPPVYTPGAPTLVAGAQASAVAIDAAGATDKVGSLSITALAAGMAAGALITVTFAVPLAATPKAIVLADRSAVANSLYVSAKSATGFTISARTAASASQAIKVDYVVTA